MSKNEKRKLVHALQFVRIAAIENSCGCERNGSDDYENHHDGCHVKAMAKELHIMHKFEIQLEASI